jgi:formate dehydrogenase iron-sulfur subunit
MVTRRDFLKITGTAAGTAAAALAGVETAQARPALDPDRVGVLCDFTLCVGCRRCEWACADANGLPHGSLESYDDKSVLDAMRRPSEHSLTVVNRYPALPGQAKPMDVKVNCLHCEHPACVSACPVSALQKDPRGPVTYDAGRCIGCRYCMVACPFDVPKFEYHEAFPIITKCTLCYEGRTSKGLPTACSEACPQDAIVFGTRRELHEEAWRRITSNPDAYNHHVYGRREVGGTEVMYLAPVDFAGLGFRKDLGQQPYSELPREFLYSVPMILTILPALLFGISMGVQGEKDKEAGR